MLICRECKKSLTGDEIGLYKKLINRESKDYLCIDCISAFFGCSKELLDEKIRYFKKTGCMLFTDLKEDKNGKTQNRNKTCH